MTSVRDAKGIHYTFTHHDRTLTLELGGTMINQDVTNSIEVSVDATICAFRFFVFGDSSEKRDRNNI